MFITAKEADLDLALAGAIRAGEDLAAEDLAPDAIAPVPPLTREGLLSLAAALPTAELARAMWEASAITYVQYRATVRAARDAGAGI
jgi:hypothetical protein